MGRGMGEEIEKTEGGLGVCGQPGGCLTSKCAGHANELRSFMVSRLLNRGAGQVLGWRNQGREPSWGAARCLGRASLDGLSGESLSWVWGGSFLPSLQRKSQALPGSSNSAQGLLGIHCPGWSGSFQGRGWFSGATGRANLAPLLTPTPPHTLFTPLHSVTLRTKGHVTRLINTLSLLHMSLGFEGALQGPGTGELLLQQKAGDQTSSTA